MEYWKQELYNIFLIEFPKYYEDSSPDYFQGSNLPGKLNKEEIKLLNKQISLPKLVGSEKKNVIHELLKDPSKDKFTFYIINTLEVDCAVNGYNSSNNTVFIEIAKRYFHQESWMAPYLISSLFKRGYQIKPEDSQIVLDLYGKFKKQTDLDKWATQDLP